MFLRVRGKVKKLLGDEEGALNDLTLAELIENGTNVSDIYPPSICMNASI